MTTTLYCSQKSLIQDPMVDIAIEALLSLGGSKTHDESSTTTTTTNSANSISSSFVVMNHPHYGSTNKKKKIMMNSAETFDPSTHMISMNNITCSSTSSSIKFPQSIMQVLQQKEIQHIFSWTQDGKSFIIHNQQTFQNHVLPNYFKGIKLDSFYRKLYRWGFMKSFTTALDHYNDDDDDEVSTRSPQQDASWKNIESMGVLKDRIHGGNASGKHVWHHDFFQRDHPHLCQFMTCSRQQ